MHLVDLPQSKVIPMNLANVLNRKDVSIVHYWKYVTRIETKSEFEGLHTSPKQMTHYNSSHCNQLLFSFAYIIMEYIKVIDPMH